MTYRILPFMPQILRLEPGLRRTKEKKSSCRRTYSFEKRWTDPYIVRYARGVIRSTLRRILGVETRNVANVIPSIGISIPDGAGLIGRPTASMAVPTMYAGVNMLSDTLSALPWNSYRGNVPADPPPPILRRPDPFTPVGVSRRQITTMLLLHGNAYCYLTAPDREGRPTVAIPIPNHEVVVYWDDTRTHARYRWRGFELEPNRGILHIKMMDAPGELLGLGPIQAARLSLSTMIAEESKAAEAATAGGVPDGIVSVPGKLTEPEADLIRKGWDERHEGKRGVAFLTGGMQWTSTRLSNQDMQFLESREYGIRDVSRLLRIPAAMLNAVSEGGSITYRNLEGVWTEYQRTGVEPLAERLEESFGELLPSTREIRHDYSRLLRADVQTRFNTYAVARQNGIYTTNEIREIEGRDPLPGGDRLDFRAEEIVETVDGTTTNDPDIQEATVDG